jgi:hypothetical protein
MKTKTILLLIGCWGVATVACGQEQEASAGLDVRGTITAGSTYSHQSANLLEGAFRAVFYPTLKLSENWAITGAVQVHSRPYFVEELSLPGHGVRTDVLQANLSYSKYWKKRSIMARVGQLSSAFGSFLLRYDDAANPLVDVPQAYGYYYDNVTTKGLAGAQVDAQLDKVDLRAQFTNSSPSNACSILDKDQYGNWAGGGGYTIRQGFRVGASVYRGQANPRSLPGTGFGVDVQWGQGPWNVNGEWQYFQMDYRLIPTFTTHEGYAEIKRTLHPRWYVATRLGYQRASAFQAPNTYELAVGYRPNTRQLIKLEYEIQQSPVIRGALSNVLAIQVVTTLKLLTLAWK